jgi:hypothetical protein
MALAILPAPAQALTLEIVNQSGQPDDEIYVNVAGAPGQYDVVGASNDSPQLLSSIPGGELTINQLVSGRVYISFEEGVLQSVPFDSDVRFDWAELTVTPSAFDVANLTAVDQFAIGMNLQTFDATGRKLEEVGSANSNTIFSALQALPGGPEATVRDPQGEILRVLSPNKSPVYPLLDQYVKSMAGQQIRLRTAFFGSPFTTSDYSGAFEADGSISLVGATNPPMQAPAEIAIDGQQLINDIYTGGNTPNTVQGAIYRDLLAGFSTGLWGGKYGNDALSFCADPITNAQGSWCPNGYNRPAFGDARTSPASFATCEQYAAVINKYSDSYGNPYSDASKKVTVGLSQPGTGGSVDTLRLAILPDSGNAQPVASGNDDCGASAGPAPDPGPEPSPDPGPSPNPDSNPTVEPDPDSPPGPELKKRALVRRGQVRLGTVDCSLGCRRIKIALRHHKQVIGRAGYSSGKAKTALRININARARELVKKNGRLNAKALVEVSSTNTALTKRRVVLVASP